MTIPTSTLARLEYFCLPSALYAAGLATATIALSGAALDAQNWSLSITLITAIAWMAHLLDRAKPLAAWNDPADRMANPRRDAFVQRYRLAMNFLTGSLGLSACILAMFIEPWLVVLVPAGAIAVVVYGSRPSDSRRPRPKDVLVLKNALTGLAYATLIGCALWAALPDRTGLWPALAIVALVVAADAILSDIDDRPADEAFGTRTVPVLAGRRRATLAAAGIYGAAMAIWAIWGTPNAAAGFVAIGLPLTGLALAVLPRTRTAIDLRAGAVALLAILL